MTPPADTAPTPVEAAASGATAPVDAAASPAPAPVEAAASGAAAPVDAAASPAPATAAPGRGPRRSRRRRVLRVFEAGIFVCAIAGGVLFGRAAADTRDASSPAVAPAPFVAATPAEVASLRTRALALVDVGAPQGWTVRFVAAQAGDPRGLADRRTRTVTVSVRVGDAPHRVAHDLAHELGHAWDATHMTAERRRAYLARRGQADAMWFPSVRGADYDTGAGDFAEVYARCHAASPEFRSTLAPAPADACAALPKAARG